MLSLIVGTVNAQENVSPLVVRAPIAYVDQSAIDNAAKEWAAQCVQKLSQEELQVVKRTLHLGANFSDLDWRARRMMRAMLAATWHVHKQLIEENCVEHFAHTLKENNKKLCGVLGLHGIVLREWRAWTTMLDVSKNEAVLSALQLVDEQVRTAIVMCLQAEDWHNIAEKVSPIVEQSVITLHVLHKLCQPSTKSKFAGDMARATDDDVSQGEASQMFFEMLAKASSQGAERSWATLEASSQISIYEEALLEISYTIYRAYHEALNEAIALCDQPG